MNLWVCVSLHLSIADKCNIYIYIYHVCLYSIEQINTYTTALIYGNWWFSHTFAHEMLSFIVIWALAPGKTTSSQGWTIMMFTASADINCFIILKLDAKKFDKCEHFCKWTVRNFCKWTVRMVSLGTPVVVLFTYLRHVHVSALTI